jgi:hypothetical protein
VADTAFPEVNDTNLDDVSDFDVVSVGKRVFDGLKASSTGTTVALGFNDPVTTLF